MRLNTNKIVRSGRFKKVNFKQLFEYYTRIPLPGASGTMTSPIGNVVRIDNEHRKNKVGKYLTRQI